ncbi:FAD-binding oxidoreductase [Ralstonia pseudosolanacearum]|uniref:Fad/fmn-containing dehydrogenase transmembrane protein n=2 Tax=Ralstonia solanacearum species complex TaxID=3116862 RepID=Q8Y309_RALN1|nr:MULTISPECIES: FAD-binding oxidoreductase [Ralstonia]AKZ27786.1 FAD-linked oxidase [Ralstonia solanacearum]APF88464.1 FAD-linked oxidase [Ralstonia solanacearum FJAT-1458]ARS54779.1 FAD-linked oxidase [Ralstonia solanacearum FJAT-91]AGH82704.1 putative oxidoreductase [Ralstonia pseudosolanacearum FQY_4]ANH34668.1 FAD-linked oxidase [Ralstonia solanacearum]
MGTVQSWGRYPYEPQQAHAVAWRDALDTTWLAATREHGTTLAFGNGRSYGDSCLAASGHVVQTRPLDRLIAADWSTGILRAEPGVTLEQLLEVAIPRGWMLPVTPGTKYATLGGAIANDVHGKNHHVRGTFGRHVRRFGLARSDGTHLECARDSHAELFAATIGGLGLTGLILWAEIQLMPIRSSLVDVTSIRFDNLDAFFALSERLDPLHEYSVAWVDCRSRGNALGRGVFMVGDHATDGPLAVDRRPKRTVPFTLPVPLFNRVTLQGFNALYFRGRRSGEVRSRVSYDRYFYPLDSLLEWNRIYGRAGFQQHQSVVPPHAARDAVRAILDAIAASGTGSFLAVLKRCGNAASPGLLSFPMEGTSLALDFPQREALNTRLFARIDAIVREAGGRMYPAKDAHMSGADFRAAYPQWQQLEALRDPAMLSRFWERTTRT